MSELREHLVKLANENPALRKKIVPLLKTSSEADWSGADIYMKSLRGSTKVLGNAITKKNERITLAESRLMLKWLSSIMTAIGKDQAADAINNAAGKVR